MTEIDGDTRPAGPPVARRVAASVAATALIAVVVVGGALALHQWRTGSAGSVGTPPELTGAAMAYDPTSGTTVMFGGHTANGTDTNQTWQWDGTQWTELAPAHSPSPRSSASLGYDPATGDLVLVGGQSVTTSKDACRPPLPVSVPPMVPGSAPGGAPTIGGGAGGGAGVATSPVSSSPGTLPGGLLATVPPTVCIVSGATQDRDTWVWTGSDWSQSSATTPAGEQGLVTDTASGSLLLLSDGFTSSVGGPAVICASGGVGIAAPANAASSAATTHSSTTDTGGPPCAGGGGSRLEVARWSNGAWNSLSLANGGPAMGSIVGMAADPVSGHAVVFVDGAGGNLCWTGYGNQPAMGNPTLPVACPMIPACSQSSATGSGAQPQVALCPPVAACNAPTPSNKTNNSVCTPITCPDNADCMSPTAVDSVLTWNGSDFVSATLGSTPPDVAAISSDPAHDDVLAYTTEGATYRWTAAGGWSRAAASSIAGPLDEAAVAPGPDGAAILMGGSTAVPIVPLPPQTEPLSTGAAASASGTCGCAASIGAPNKSSTGASASASETATPLVVVSASASPSETATPTESASPTASPSAIPTPTESASPSASPSDGAASASVPAGGYRWTGTDWQLLMTVAPSESPSASASASASASPSSVVSPSPSASASPSASPEPTPSATPCPARAGTTLSSDSACPSTGVSAGA